VEQLELERASLMDKLNTIESSIKEEVKSERGGWKREMDRLHSELDEAQQRVSELVGLVGNFAADARNSERLVGDLL